MQSKISESRKKQFFSKLLRWTGVFLFFILIVCYIIFKSSYAQTLICEKVSKYLSQKTETTITIKEVDFRPFDTFILKDLLILDHKKDTMLFSSDFHFELNDYNFKTLDFNLEFVELNNSHIAIKTYKGEKESNIVRFIQKIREIKSEKKQRTPKIKIDKIELKGLKCLIWDENTDNKKNNGIDFNHLDLKIQKLSASDFIFKKNYFKLKTKLYSFEERSGFELIDMSCEIAMNKKTAVLDDLKIKTNESDAHGYVKLKYPSFKAFNNFLDSVTFNTYFEETKISSNDLAFFVPVLKDLNQSIKFDGNIYGTVSNLKAKNLKFRYGKQTRFKGEIEFDGLGFKKDPIIRAKITNLITFENDIKKIPIFPFSLGKTIKTPLWMKKIGKIEFKGEFIGPMSDFEAAGILKTKAGSIKSDVHVKRDSKDETKIIGKIITTEFDLGKTIGNPNFGLISMNGELNALAQFNDNRLIFSGKIPRVDYKGYSYSNIKMDGTIRDKIYKGIFTVNDDNLVFDFDGSVDFSLPNLQKYDFVAELKKANLRNINLSLRDSSTRLRGELKVNMLGNQLEDLNGRLMLKNLIWEENGKSYKIDSCNLNSIKNKEREMIVLKSDIMDAKIEGVYNLKDIYPTIVGVLSKDIPSIKNNNNLNTSKEYNTFNLMFKFYDYSLINELFTPNINLSKRTKLSGRFDNKLKSFSLNFASDSVLIKKKALRDVKIYINNNDGGINLAFRSKLIQIANKIDIENIILNSSIEDNKLNYNASYSNKKRKASYGNISGAINFSNLDSIKLNINSSKLVHQDTIWKLDKSFNACLANQYIEIRNFNLSSNNQFFGIEGICSALNSDRMIFELKNFQLKSLDYFWSAINLDLQGKATGNLKLDGGFNEQVFFTNLNVTNMLLNGQKFGKLNLNTFFKKSTKIINVNLSVTNKKNTLNNLLISGKYYPYKKGKIEMNANLMNTELKFLERYFEGVFSKFKGGKTTGNLAINGTLKHPLFVGKLNVDHLRFSVDYLNVDYGADAQTLTFKNDFILFKNFTLSHDLHPKSKAKVNGFVNLNGFKNISYQFDSVFLEQFYCLNTTLRENSTYYGQAYVDGLLQFRGDGNQNYIGGSVSTTKSTKLDALKQKYITVSTALELPLDESEELEMSEFASFVNLSNINSSASISQEDFNVSGINLDFNFKINPEANVRILFDPAVGDEINAKGNGSIGMLINSDGKFNMYGDFSVTQGNYFFTLQNIIGKKFVVEPGSKISWNGDPLDAQMNMKTYYKSRANLINLVVDSTLNTFDNRIQVNSNIGLFGSLWKPRLKIGISLPNGTPEEISFLKDKVFSDDEINRQAFSLILTSRFLPLSSSVGSIVNDKAGLHNGMQFVEGQINNALSGLLHPNLDLGVDYNEVDKSDSEEDLTKDELRLLAGFKYKNLSLKTDYDINNQVGDIEAEFKITEAFKAKAYHKTITDATALNNQITTTYGLGAAYQKSFDYFKDLFRKKQ